MFVKSNGKKVDVSREECVKFCCFSPHKYTHRRQTIDGKANNWQNKKYSCSHRDFHGCPDEPEVKESL